MPSLHTDAAFRIAEAKGAFAGADYSRWNALVSLSKRELVEIALRLGAQVSGDLDSPEAGFQQVLHEHATLNANGVL